MNPEKFEEKYNKDWERFEQWLAAQETPMLKTDLQVHEVPHLYRRICNHLSLAKDRMYSPQLIDRLNRLALAGHSLLYKTRAGSLSKIVQFFLVDFPSAVRQEAKFFWLAFLLFFGPFFGIIILLYFQPELVYDMVSAGEIRKAELNFDPAVQGQFLGRRGSAGDFEMFGFYILNNTTISIKVFTFGLLLGLGSVYILLVNGIGIGAVVGHLLVNGFSATLMPFIVGHSSFELLAIVIAGAAGFKIGFSIIHPGQKTRTRALVDASKVAIVLVVGFIIMDFIAAFIEAFWSSQVYIAPMTKYVVGGLFWVLIMMYFLFAGRKYET